MQEPISEIEALRESVRQGWFRNVRNPGKGGGCLGQMSLLSEVEMGNPDGDRLNSNRVQFYKYLEGATGQRGFPVTFEDVYRVI